MGRPAFYLKAGGVRILIEPPQKESGINPPRLKSDVLIYSQKVPASAKATAGKQETSEETFVIDSPGEYEIKGVNIQGIADNENIIYNIKMDDMKISHLGFANKKFDNEKLAEFDDPDIVLVPVGGDKILDAEEAMSVINQLEPNIAVPMLYEVKGLKIKRASLLPFLKESEAKQSPQPKLAIKKKDLTEEETRIVILEQS